MANTNINLTSLDFADYKNSLKTFLRSQNAYKDYDFEGSNMNVILDLLSYNTYQNAFYLNMVGSEMFLDTAQMKDSVVLKAKELNYTPRSFNSAVANVNLTVTTGNSQNIILSIPKGTSFTGKSGANNYSFTTDRNLTLQSGNGTFVANNISLYEGTYVTDTFVVSYAQDPQKFLLSNPTIDTSSLTVTIVENNGANVIPYQLSRTILDLATDSKVYFLQGGVSSQYEIIFGDNVVGRKPADSSVVIAEYRITNGQLPNGINVFKTDGTIGGTSNVIVTVNKASQGGDIGETIESIRRNAPRFYATQERAVTVKDYETLLSLTYPEIQAVSVYGGEEVTPPQYGKVIISLKIANFDALPDSKKAEYIAFLKTRAPLTIDPVFVEPNYLYASVKTTVKYDINQTSLNPEDIAALVTTKIQNFNLTNLNNFKSSLYYSKLTTDIDTSHFTVVSNQTDYEVMKKLIPDVGVYGNYKIEFNLPLANNLPPVGLIHPSNDLHTISSSKFVYDSQLVSIEDDGNGVIRIVKEMDDGNHSTLTNIGTVDYDTGVISLTSLTLSSYYGDSIRIYAMPANKDNETNQNTIFEIPNDEINVTIQTVRI